MSLVLASSSPYRRALLARLGLPFSVMVPAVDESPRRDETPERLVRRLAQAKAQAVAAGEALVIGSDQVACCHDQVLGKPGDLQRACAQLEQVSGQRVEFLTGLALLNPRSGAVQVDCIRFRVYFRTLSRAQIEGYVAREQPLDCAGSFKSEGLGIALFHRLEGDDPTALVGLPLMRLVEMLAAEGFDVLVPRRLTGV